jgi:exopolyphosphatase/guanosine-5'-triphosphate,3'-diphosphate pyrophosphatase
VRPPRLAVVDLGSNSVRLLLCEVPGPQGPWGERVATVTGLRRGAGPDGDLAPDALERLDRCLAGYAERVARFGPDRVVCVGTSAVRDAPNAEAVEAIVRARLGAPLRVLTGEEEAELAFAGAALAAPAGEEILLVDVGGGSTELVRGAGGRPAGAVSLQLGAVRHTERHLPDDPPAPAQLAALRADARGLLVPALAEIGGPAPAVGVAGTVTSLAAIELGGYDSARVHGHVLTRDRVERLLLELAAMGPERRRAVPGLDPARAGVIVAGAAIVAELLAVAGLDRMIVSERDILDGVAMAAAGLGGSSFPL